MKTRKEREKETLKRQILDVARKLFINNGFEKTSIRSIAEEIEYSPSIIYLYFKDKNELFYELHTEAFNSFFSELMGSVISDDPFDRLEQLGHRYLKFGLENPELYNLLFIMEAPMDALKDKAGVWQEGRDAFAILKFMIGEAQNVGFFGEVEVEHAALTLLSYMHGIITLHNFKRLAFFNHTKELTDERIKKSFEFVSKLCYDTKKQYL